MDGSTYQDGFVFVVWGLHVRDVGDTVVDGDGNGHHTGHLVLHITQVTRLAPGQQREVLLQGLAERPAAGVLALLGAATVDVAGTVELFQQLLLLG